MVSHIFASSFESVYEILPTTIDDNKLQHIKDCVCLWLVYSIISLCTMCTCTIPIMFYTLTIQSVIFLSILFTIFGILFTYSLHNFILLHRYFIDLKTLKSLSQEFEEMEIV